MKTNQLKFKDNAKAGVQKYHQTSKCQTRVLHLKTTLKYLFQTKIKKRQNSEEKRKKRSWSCYRLISIRNNNNNYKKHLVKKTMKFHLIKQQIAKTNLQIIQFKKRKQKIRLLENLKMKQLMNKRKKKLTLIRC